MRYKVSIKGVAPLLQHRYPVENGEEKIKKRTGARDYSDEAEISLHRDEKGNIYEPSDHILGALIKAASNFLIGGRGKKTYKEIIKSSLFVSPDAIPHQNQKWVKDARPVVVQRSRIIRERPMFKDWGLSFEVEAADEQLAENALKQIFDYAGAYCGIGDFRPRFGRFIVTEFKAI